MKQRTEEWYAARTGKITASRFGDVIAAPTTQRYQLYLNEIVSELTGAPHMETYSPWFKHGVDLEPIAKERYEFEKILDGEDVTIEETGFIIHPNRPYIGCSPDGRIGNKGIEIKSSISHQNFKKMSSSGKLPGVYKPQVQGELWICGFESLDFVMFFRDPDGNLPDEIKIIEVLPDPEYHKFLDQKCLDFWELAEGLCLEFEWRPDELG